LLARLDNQHKSRWRKRHAHNERPRTAIKSPPLVPGKKPETKEKEEQVEEQVSTDRGVKQF